MEKVALVKSKKIKSFQKLFNRQEFNKIKNEGIVLKTANKDLQIKINDQIFEKDYKKPEISVYNKNDISIAFCVTFPENADEAFIEYKTIEKYPTQWENYGRIQSPQKNRIYEFESEKNPGKPCKFRVTYFKDSAIRYSDSTLSDIRYDFFQDPPEIVVLNSDSVLINVFNVQRFSSSGFIKLFRKENEENLECIASSKITGKIFSFNDTKAKNLNLYEYFAEVYDNLGNMYKTDKIKIDLRNAIERRRLEILNDKKGKYINIKNEERIVISIYDTEKEKASINIYDINKNKIIPISNNKECTCEIEEDKLYFDIDSQFKSFLVQIEGYLNDNVISHGFEIQEFQKQYKITNVTVETNKNFQNIIKWNYEGDIDSFIVTARNSKKSRILEKLSHRRLNRSYIYCIDTNSTTERLNTEYIINGIDEFGKIIAKSRIIKNAN